MAFEQKDLDDLSRELINFTKGMDDFITKGGFKGSSGQPETSDKAAKSFDVGTAKIVNALGTLAAQLTKNARSEAQQTRYVENFNKAVEKATETQNKAAADEKRRVDRAAAIQAARQEALDKTIEEAEKKRLKRRDISQKISDSLDKSVTDAKGSFDFLDISSRQLSEGWGKQGKAAKVLAASFEAMAKSVSGYTSALYNGERGAKVTAKALTELSQPLVTLSEVVGNVISAISLFLPGGLLVKGLVFLAGQAIPALVKGLVKYNELASEQADKLYETFMGLSKGGVNLSGGLTETFDTMQRFGMSVAEATEFTSMLAGSAKDLKYLGTTAGQGAKEFAKVAGTLYKSDVGKQLQLMGVSAEEQRESALKFMSIQARTGQIQTKNTADLVKASAAFTKELDLAAELAGTTRKEQMEAREMAMSDERWRAAMDEATQSGDKDRVAELEKANAMAAQLRAAGDEQGAAGVLQLAASRGALTTEAAIAAQMQYGAGDFIFDRSKTKENLGEIMGGMSTNAKRQNSTFNSVGSMIGNVAGMQTTGVGARDFTARNDALRAAMEKEGFKGTIDEYLQTEQGKRANAPDAKLAAQTELRRTQQNTAMMMDSFVNSFIDVSKINENAAKIFSAAVDKFGAATGSKVAGGGLSTTTPKFLSTTKTNTNVAPGQFDANGGGAAFGNPNISRSAAKSKASSTSQSPAQGSPISGNSVTSSADALSLLSFGGESGTRESFLQLDSDIQQKVLAAAADYNQQTGNKLRINSAMRSFEKQQELYDAYISGKSKFPAAKPGTSLHESGRAIDIEQGKNDAVAIASLIKQGLSQPIKNDPVHFQARTGGIFRGPSTGYNVELHGDEMVIPANDGVSKQALNTSVFNQDTSMIGDLMDMFQTMQYKYDQMIDLLSRQADNGDKLVQAAY